MAGCGFEANLMCQLGKYIFSIMPHRTPHGGGNNVSKPLDKTSFQLAICDISDLKLYLPGMYGFLRTCEGTLDQMHFLFHSNVNLCHRFNYIMRNVFILHVCG